MTATLRDVAREAGVSIRTVSRVVNHKAEIAHTTRQRVLSAISRLDYRPNTLARGLVSGKTRSLAVVIPQITDPFYPEFVQGVESVARAQEYHVFLSHTDDDPAQEYHTLEALAGKQVEGVILCGTRLNDAQLLQANALHTLVVITNRPPRTVPTIHVQEAEGLFAVTSHLIALGHHHIGHIARLQHGRSARLEGYQQAIAAHGLAANPQATVAVNVAHIESGRAAARRLLAQCPAVTAITCYNDLTAIGAMQACQMLGRQVPTDIAVVGFDDLTLAELVSPALTTVHVARHRLGQMAGELLLQLRADPTDIPAPWQLPTSLVVRASCGTTSAPSSA